MSRFERRFELIASVADSPNDLLCGDWLVALKSGLAGSDYREDYASLVVDTAVIEGLPIPDSSILLTILNQQAMNMARSNHKIN